MLQSRIVSSLTRPLNNPDAALPQVFGAIVGLSELGTDVINRIILPRLRRISERLEQIQADRTISDKEKQKFQPTDHDGATHIEDTIKKKIFPEVKNIRQPPDIYEQYINDYGNYLGEKAFSIVKKDRMNKIENAGAHTLPDLQQLAQHLRALITDPRIQNLDKCYDLAKRSRIRRLQEKLVQEGELYTEAILEILEKQS